MFWYVGVAFSVWLFIRLVLKSFPSKLVNLSDLPGWAVVTGATDGIGKAFTRELARQGFNVVLVSRSEDRLRMSAKEIEDEFRVSTKIVAADFTCVEWQMFERIARELEGVEIGVLVNNVGMTTPHPEYFLNLEKNHRHVYSDIVNVNVVSAVNMTRLVLPGMIDRRKGLIINVASGLGEFPSPLNSLYGASKAFLIKFSEDLNTEVKAKGVHVHVLTTGLVSTKLSGVNKTNLICPSPSVYAASALKMTTSRTRCDGYYGHAILTSIGRIVHIFLPGILPRIVMQLTSKAREKFIKKCPACSPK